MTSYLLVVNCVVLFALIFGSVVCPRTQNRSDSLSRTEPLLAQSTSGGSHSRNNRMNGVKLLDVTSRTVDDKTETLDHGLVVANDGYWYYYEEKNWNKRTGKVNPGAPFVYSYNIDEIIERKMRRDGMKVHFSTRDTETGLPTLVTWTFANIGDAKRFNQEV